MTIKLYKLDASPPARAAMMACEIFGVAAEMLDLDLLNGAHRTPEYLKKNPVHTVPVFEDGDFIIHDSHAILTYLADAYGKTDSMYPKDVKKRTLVNQKLFFDTAILFPRVRNITTPAIFSGVSKPQQQYYKDIEEAYGMLEEFLSRSKYLAGDNITIADVAAITNVTSLNILLPLNGQEFPKVSAWVKDLESQPFCKKYNAPGTAELATLMKQFLD